MLSDCNGERMEWWGTLSNGLLMSSGAMQSGCLGVSASDMASEMMKRGGEVE